MISALLGKEPKSNRKSITFYRTSNDFGSDFIYKETESNGTCKGGILLLI